MESSIHRKTPGHKQPTWPYLLCYRPEHLEVVRLQLSLRTEEQVLQTENRTSEGWAVGFGEADEDGGLAAMVMGRQERRAGLFCT